MKTFSLNGTWKLRGQNEIRGGEMISIDATVPGCVQLDLSRHGLLPEDLFLGMNIRETEKYEEYEWWYERSFEAPGTDKNVYLVFEGVDCVAEYFLNGEKIGESDNMYIAHEFCLDGLLKKGENTLTVHLRSPQAVGLEGDMPMKHVMFGSKPQWRYLRKAPHMGGWDIMPRAVTSGLWREVRLEIRDSIRFSQYFFHTHFAPDFKHYRLGYTLEADSKAFDGVEMELKASCGEDSVIYAKSRVTSNRGVLYFNIPNVKPWWPYGYGEPNVYDGTLSILQNGEVVHSIPVSFGVRRVELERRDALNGDEGQFRFLINGVEIMCKGTNWVPLDAFHCRDAERYDEALALVKDIGCNIVRCWGGNVYEDHKFFDFCDRNGIMVWQDFAMACASYPEDDIFKKKLAEEATAVIRKLRNHPSLILWSGDNEVDSGTQWMRDPNSNSLTREVLPKCVDLNDIERPYMPSSPFLTTPSYEAGVRSQAYDTPLIEDHLWGPRDYYKSDYYKHNKAHFISETGYHGCPSFASIKKFTTPERHWPYAKNEEWILHSSDQSGNDARLMLLEQQVRQLFGEVPTDPETFVLASQISQAEAKKYLIERMRIKRPYTTGIIWWNLLDGWPQISDAIVDYYFTKKMAYAFVKRAQAPFTVTADEPKEWGLPIYACNDTLEAKKGHLVIKDAESDEVLWQGDFAAAANGSTKIAHLPLYFSEKKIIIFQWEVDGVRGINHYLCGFPPISLDMYTKVLKKYPELDNQ